MTGDQSIPQFPRDLVRDQMTALVPRDFSSMGVAQLTQAAGPSA